MNVTVNDIMALQPCYSRSHVEALWGARPALTAREIAALAIPADDRVWALIRLLDERRQRLWACDHAEAACTAAGWTDPRSLSAIAVSRRYADGLATAAELTTARAAAGDAAGDAGAAGWAAARATAWAAAWDVAWDVARDAGWDAGWAATAWDAAWAAELESLVRLLEVSDDDET